MSQQNLILFINNTIHCLNMLLEHRKIYFWLNAYLENAQTLSDKFLVGKEIVYLDAIEMFIVNDLVLKLHGLLESQGGEDYILNPKFNLNDNPLVKDSVDRLKEIFCLSTIYHIRNRYVGHLDVNHEKRNKARVAQPEDANDLDEKFSNMLSIDNLENAINLFSDIFNVLDGNKQNTIDDIKKGSNEFWRRYRLGIREKTGLT